MKFLLLFGITVGNLPMSNSNSNVTILLMWHIDRQTFDELVWILFFSWILSISVLNFSIIQTSRNKSNIDLLLMCVVIFIACKLHRKFIAMETSQSVWVACFRNLKTVLITIFDWLFHHSLNSPKRKRFRLEMKKCERKRKRKTVSTKEMMKRFKANDASSPVPLRIQSQSRTQKTFAAFICSLQQFKFKNSEITADKMKLLHSF